MQRRGCFFALFKERRQTAAGFCYRRLSAVLFHIQRTGEGASGFCFSQPIPIRRSSSEKGSRPLRAS